jgi:hypothetical protein
MSKQPTPSQGTRRKSAENEQNVKQSHDRQGGGAPLSHRQSDKSVQEGGGEESKHGRKQKGNVDDN